MLKAKQRERSRYACVCVHAASARCHSRPSSCHSYARALTTLPSSCHPQVVLSHWKGRCIAIDFDEASNATASRKLMVKNTQCPVRSRHTTTTSHHTSFCTSTPHTSLHLTPPHLSRLLTSLSPLSPAHLSPLHLLHSTPLPQICLDNFEDGQRLRRQHCSMPAATSALKTS